MAASSRSGGSSGEIAVPLMDYSVVKGRRLMVPFQSGFTLVEILVVIAIIAVLAGLLLPALVFARERGRRSACVSNLKQMGMATESYFSDYGGYMPGALAWGAEPGTPNMADSPQWFTYKGQRVKVAGVVDSTWGTAADQRSPKYGMWRPTTLFYGHKQGTANNDDDWTAGKLNVAPVNLGWLVFCGYLGNAALFSCPSNGAALRSQAAMELNVPADQLLFADWRLARLCPAPGQPGQNALNYRWRGSDYMYRCAPTYVYRDNGAAAYWEQEQPVLYTLPRIMTSAGCPMFKTQRLLGARALICDRWDKFSYLPRTSPGAGKDAHQEGYNVLYGDWHADWYGDPRKQFMYWDQPRKITATGASFGLSSGYDPNLTQAEDADAWYDYRTQGMLGWHLMDTRADVDVGATAD